MCIFNVLEILFLNFIVVINLNIMCMYLIFSYDIFLLIFSNFVFK